MIVTFITNGQSEIDSVKINNDFLNKCKCINPASLIGKWESTDTIKNRIEFFFDQNEMILREYSTRLPMDQLNSFNFFLTDSFPFVSTEGMLIQWPPYGCSIKQIDKNSIELKYSFFGSDTILKKYNRMTFK